MNKSISLVLATYNGEKYILEQLDSIMNQELLPEEIIIIDDCSIDETYEILISYDFREIKVQIIKNERNLGPIANFKKGINLATGDFIALCDQDDVWLPHKLKLSLEAILLLNQEKPCMVYSDLTLVDENMSVLSDSLHKLWKVNPKYYDLSFISFSNIVTGCTILFNKKMQKELRYMPTNIIMHDYWMGLIGYSFGEVKYMNETTILYRSHHSSVTSKERNSFFEDMKNSKKNIKNQVDQIELFRKVYKNRFSTENEKVFETFLKLSTKPYFIQRVYMKLRKYIKKQF